MQILFTLFFLFAQGSQAKRPAPPLLPPVYKGAIAFEVQSEPLTSGCIESSMGCGMILYVLSRPRGEPPVNWRTELYRVHYDLRESDDGQQIKPISLKMKSREEIEVTDQRGARYRVNVETGKLLEPLVPLVYKKD